MYDCNRFGKKITLDDRWMAQAARLRKKWTTGSAVLKKSYFLYKNVMLQIDPIKSSCSHRQQKEQLFEESVCSESHCC